MKKKYIYMSGCLLLLVPLWAIDGRLITVGVSVLQNQTTTFIRRQVSSSSSHVHLKNLVHFLAHNVATQEVGSGEKMAFLAFWSLLLVALLPTAVVIMAIPHELSFLESPQYSVALPGDSVYFSCKTNLPASLENITWLHNGLALEGLTGSGKARKSKGHLTFKVSQNPDIYEKQVGKYQCIGSAIGSLFRLASEEAELSIAQIGEFKVEKDVTIEVFEVNITKLKTLAVPALKIRSVAALRITWMLYHIVRN
jgi:hypothetical protein